jgi:hypothetical protein
MPALTITGLSGTHFHDLRHVGNQSTADAGANPCELMERMGHGSARAALIYLRSTAERQRSLAIEIGKNAKAALGKPDGKPKRSGTRKVHRRGGPLVPAQNLCFAWSDLASAPGRIRTRDPLLRRQLLCPAELRAPGNKCAWRMSHDGYTEVAVSSLEPVRSPPGSKHPAAISPGCPRVPQPAVSPQRVPSPISSTP